MKNLLTIGIILIEILMPKHHFEIWLCGAVHVNSISASR
jgi:hypothetical protein